MRERERETETETETEPSIWAYSQAHVGPFIWAHSLPQTDEKGFVDLFLYFIDILCVLNSFCKCVIILAWDQERKCCQGPN